MTGLIKQKSKRKGGYRTLRKRKEKVLHKKRLRSRIHRKRGWKLQFQEFFKEINEYPYIIRD